LSLSKGPLDRLKERGPVIRSHRSPIARQPCRAIARQERNGQHHPDDSPFLAAEQAPAGRQQVEHLVETDEFTEGQQQADEQRPAPKTDRAMGVRRLAGIAAGHRQCERRQPQRQDSEIKRGELAADSR